MASSSSSSSSFSTLSAKARPFVPPKALPFSSQTTLSAKAAPFSNPNHNSASSHLGAATGPPFYPCYVELFDSYLVGYDGLSSTNYDGGDDGDLSCDFGGLYTPWNTSFDKEEVTKMEESDAVSSLWRIPSLDCRGVQPKGRAPCKISGGSTSALSSQKTISTCSSESYNASNSNSRYNHQMTQHYTFSEDAVEYLHPFSSLSVAHSSSKFIDNVQALPEESTTTQKFKHEENFDGTRKANNNSILNSSSLRYDSTLTKPIKLQKTLDNSSEKICQLDLDVDSPCWKGALAYQRSPFFVNEAKPMHNLEKSEGLISDETNISSYISFSEKSLDVASSSLQKKSEERKIDTISEEQNNVISEEQKIDPILLGKSSSTAQYEQLIDETLQCLRKGLLSRAYKGENALKKLLSEVLGFVNDYPGGFDLKNEMGTADGSNDDFGKEASWSIVSELKNADTSLNLSNIKTFNDTDKQEKTQPNKLHTTHLQDSVLELARSHTIAHNFDNLTSNLYTVKSMTNDFDIVLKKNLCDQEENVHTLLHKNLWIEEQVKLFSLKYELQLARAEIEMLKQNLSPKGRVQEATPIRKLGRVQLEA